ncbi:MAG TPA: alpha-L-rhamnosidase C-terminal domain-containing protein, partial [Pseudacidobacterium sp.]|nr:alpha-L-rhamnosidase C-terminal domain-containing protein [Pseudacidobacterium sp.]
ANVLAVWQDVAPRDEQQKILERVLASRENQSVQLDGSTVPPMSAMSYYFRFYLARALEHAGLAGRYLDELTPWRGMLKLGLSTWAEQPEPTRSDCHAWSASPNYDLLTVVAGIHPASPGFKTVRIEPHLGKLTHLDATMPHAGGEIRVGYQKQGNEWTARVELPSGLTGEFVWNGKSHPLHAGKQILRVGER